MLEIYDWIGCVGFAMIGYLSALKHGYNKFIAFCCAILTAFGGGALLRDGLILGDIPFILNFPVQIAFVFAISAILWILCTFIEKLKWERMPFIFKCGLILCDSLGVVAFIHIGIRQATQADLTLSSSLIVCCGVVTASGGGICALLLKRLVKKFFKKSRIKELKAEFNTSYCIFAGFIALLYSFLLSNGVSGSMLLVAITPFAVIGGFIAEADIRKEAIKFIYMQRKSKRAKYFENQLIKTGILRKNYKREDLEQLVSYIQENKYLIEPKLYKTA